MRENCVYKDCPYEILYGIKKSSAQKCFGIKLNHDVLFCVYCVNFVRETHWWEIRHTSIASKLRKIAHRGNVGYILLQWTRCFVLVNPETADKCVEKQPRLYTCCTTSCPRSRRNIKLINLSAHGRRPSGRKWLRTGADDTAHALLPRSVVVPETLWGNTQEISPSRKCDVMGLGFHDDNTSSRRKTRS